MGIQSEKATVHGDDFVVGGQSKDFERVRDGGKYLMEVIRGPKRHDQWNIVIVGRLDWREAEFWWHADPSDLRDGFGLPVKWNFKRKEMIRN